MTITIYRKPTLAALTLVAGLVLSPATHATPADTRVDVLHVTLTPTCGCCGAWAELAEAHGHEVELSVTEDYAGMKDAGDVPEALWSCHTATIAGYTIEGHVPFDVIDRLLAERPDIAGIAVPGMPAGSPGMGDDPDATYEVIAFGGSADDGEIFERMGD